MGQRPEEPGTDAPGGVKTYRDYTDDFVETRKQDTKLPEDVVWVHSSALYRFWAAVLYKVAIVFTFFYTKFMHMKVVNRKVLKECRGSGYFIFGNHTQPMGDAFFPVRCVQPKRLYIIMGPANLGIPFIGKLLPVLGGITIPDSVEGMRGFLQSLRDHLDRGHCIGVYPEAHVWPWCDFIRPFSDTSFRYPVMFKVPAFCMTTTYQRRRHGKKPHITTYVDGPFYPQSDLSGKEAQKKLHDEVFACMCERSKNSTYEYVRYVKEKDA